MSTARLKAAMEEIKPILKKHDIGAIVILASQTDIEYLYEISPTWSCAKLTPEGQLRIRALASMYPDKATHKKTVENTTGLFFGFCDLLDKAKRDMMTVMVALGGHFDISHYTREK